MKFKLTLVLVFLSIFVFGQVDMAEYRRSVQLNNEASAAMDNGNYEIAVEKLLEAISLDSIKREYYLNLYRACFQLEKYALLLPYMEKAGRIFREDDELFYYTGNIFQRTGNTEQAIIQYDSAIFYSKVNGEDYPLVYAYYLNRGNCYLKSGKFEPAVDDLSQAIARNELDGAAYANRGVAYFQLGKKVEACSDWQKAVELGQNVAAQYIEKYCSD